MMLTVVMMKMGDSNDGGIEGDDVDGDGGGDDDWQ